MVSGVVILYAVAIWNAVAGMSGSNPRLWLWLALVVDFPMFISPIVEAVQWSPWTCAARMPRFDEVLVLEDSRSVVLQARDRAGAVAEARVRTHLEAEQRLAEAGATRVGVFSGAIGRSTRARNLVGAVTGACLLLLLIETFTETVYVTNWLVGPVAVTGVLLTQAMVARQTVLFEGSSMLIHSWRGTEKLQGASIAQAQLVDDDVHLVLTDGRRRVFFAPSSVRALLDRLKPTR